METSVRTNKRVSSEELHPNDPVSHNNEDTKNYGGQQLKFKCVVRKTQK